MKKKIISIIISMITILTLTSFAACGDTNGGGTSDGGKTDGGKSGKMQTYVMEAEFCDLDNVKGSGISSDQQGVEMIYGDGDEEDIKKGWSSGYYVGYTYTADFSLDFVFNSDKAEKAALTLALGSELGDNITLTPDIFVITLNGVAINYGTISVESSDGMENMKFFDKQISGSVELKEGENIINIKINPNDLKLGVTGGPTIDCLKIKTKAGITFTEKKDNPDLRGGF